MTTRRTFRTSHRRRTINDAGQTALIMVIGLVILLTTIGGVMMTNIVANDPILTQASIQRYAYRALASGLNAYQSAVNADPYLGACNADTNPGGPDASTQCATISYGTWSQVPGTGVGNGIIPEYYKFDNPQQVTSSTTNELVDLEVQIVGAAGFPGKDVYYSTVAKFVPANGFLNNVWWTNYESTGTPSQCTYYWTSYSTPANCTPVFFDSQDHITGPIFSNDSIYVDGGPNFGVNYGVTTADPKCQFVDPGATNGANNLGKVPNPAGSNSNCAVTATAESVTYDAAKSSYSAKNYETIPTDNSELGNYAKQGGCYYEGPTTVTLIGNQMTVLSKGTSATAGANADPLNFGSDTSNCPTDGTTKVSLPANGVIFVAGGDYTGKTNINPFEGIGSTCNSENPCTQTQPGGCNGCYYGQTGSPDTEGDAFVSGSLSGQLTIGANNDVIIQGPITYADCTSWVGTAQQSACNYNNALTGVNDTLGLIAYNYVEVSRPVDGNGNVLGYCGQGGSLPAPLCNPATKNGGGLIIDASLLGLQQSFIVNNYQQGANDGQLYAYGSIQQDARGPVATIQGGNVQTGYGKTYTWDPRLALYSPPFYLTPGTASWALDSSAESYCGLEPPVPPVQQTPSTSQPAWPTTCGGSPPSGWTTGTPAS
ncbi:MAG: hypothetical protein ACLQPH_06415 [Acidimicrobiales bacterium]